MGPKANKYPAQKKGSKTEAGGKDAQPKAKILEDLKSNPIRSSPRKHVQEQSAKKIEKGKGNGVLKQKNLPNIKKSLPALNLGSTLKPSSSNKENLSGTKRDIPSISETRGDIEEYKRASIKNKLYDSNTSFRAYRSNQSSSMPLRSFVEGNRLMNILAGDNSREHFEACLAKDLCIDAESNKKDIVQRFVDRYLFYSDLNDKKIQKLEKITHGAVSENFFEIAKDAVRNGELQQLDMYEVSRILREARPYIYKTLNSIREMELSEKSTVHFSANTGEFPPSENDLGLLNYLRNDSVNKEIENTRNCLTNSETILANLWMLQMTGRNLQQLKTCKNKVFTDLYNNLYMMNALSEKVINHLIEFPEHLKTVICAMGDVSNDTLDDLLSPREELNNFSNISGQEYNILIQKERDMDYLRFDSERKVRQKKLNDALRDKNKGVTQRKSILDYIEKS